MKIFAEIEPVYYICSVKETNFVRLVKWKIQCKLPPKTKRFCPLVLK